MIIWIEGGWSGIPAKANPAIIANSPIKEKLVQAMSRTSNPEFVFFVNNQWAPYIKGAKFSWQVDDRIARLHIVPNLGCLKLRDISAEKIRAWYHSLLSSGLAVTTCNRILYVLKNIFNFAVNSGFLKKSANPLDSVRWIRTQKTRARTLLPGDVDAIFSRLITDGRTEAKVLQVLLYTGASKNEVLKAKWENFYPEKNLLLGERMGGKKLREIWLPLEANKILCAQQKVDGSPWIFPGRDKSKPFSDIYIYWNELRSGFGLDELKINEYRKNWLRQQLTKGFEIKKFFCVKYNGKKLD